MKKIIIGCMLLATVGVMAQRGEGHDRAGMKDLSAEQIGELQSKKATLALDLNDSQQAQMKALFIEEAKMRKTKMEERKAARESGESKKLTADERYEKANERLDHQIAKKEAVKNILNDEQFEKWKKMQHRKGKHSKGKHKGDKNKDGKKKPRK